MSEQERREKAQAHAGEVAEGSGVGGKPRRIAQMVSVRLDGELVAILRALAEARGVTMSAILKEAAREFVRKSLGDAP